MVDFSPMRHARRRFGWRRAVRVVAMVVSVVTVSTVSVSAIAVWQTLGRMSPSIHLATPSSELPAAPAAPGPLAGAINVLLVGTDTRTGQGSEFDDDANQSSSSGFGNNDVTMVLHVTADHTHATVVSIPRDTMLPVPECPSPEPDASPGESVDATDSAMFNTTLRRGGLACTVLTAEKLTGLTIPYAAIIDFEGVKAMSQAVGGVTVCVATPIDDADTGLHLDAGEQVLLGENALQFVRTRHGVGDGSDLGRITDQQIFLSALVRKMTSAGVLANPLTLYALANAVAANLSRSDSLADPAQLISIALAVKDIIPGRLSFVRYPVVADPDDRNRVIPDANASEPFNEALRADRTITPQPTADNVPAPPGDSLDSAPTSQPTPSPTQPAIPNVDGQNADAAACAVGN